MRTFLVAVGLLVGMAGCSKKPSAADVCKQVESSGVGSGCRAGQPSGLGAAAVEKSEFDLPSVPGKTGMVLRFKDETGYDTTVKAFENAAALAGPHRYGSKKALVFVQMNNGLDAAAGAKVKAVVDAL